MPHQKSTLLTSWSWTFSPQDCEKITFCCLSHPVLVDRLTNTGSLWEKTSKNCGVKGCTVFLFELEGNSLGPRVKPVAWGSWVRHCASEEQEVLQPGGHQARPCLLLLLPASPAKGPIKHTVKTNPQLLRKSQNTGVSHPEWMTCGPKSTTSIKCRCVAAR